MEWSVRLLPPVFYFWLRRITSVGVVGGTALWGCAAEPGRASSGAGASDASAVVDVLVADETQALVREGCEGDCVQYPNPLQAARVELSHYRPKERQLCGLAEIERPDGSVFQESVCGHWAGIAFSCLTDDVQALVRPDLRLKEGALDFFGNTVNIPACQVRAEEVDQRGLCEAMTPSMQAAGEGGAFVNGREAFADALNVLLRQAGREGLKNVEVYRVLGSGDPSARFAGARSPLAALLPEPCPAGQIERGIFNSDEAFALIAPNTSGDTTATSGPGLDGRALPTEPSGPSGPAAMTMLRGGGLRCGVGAWRAAGFARVAARQVLRDPVAIARADAEIFDEMGHAQSWLSDRYRCVTSPLALDLDGRGVATERRGIRFDFDADGTAEATTWLKPGNGLLVYGDQVTNGAELFGPFSAHAAGAEDGFASLKTLDANGDGRIDKHDPAFPRLSVWEDKDGDGVPSRGEVRSLAAYNIESLSLAVDPHATLDSAGSVLSGFSHFTRRGGARGTLVDVFFARD